MNIANYDLEDATVLDFQKKNNTIILKLEQVMTSTEKHVDGLLSLHGVSNIVIEVNPIDHIKPYQRIDMIQEYGKLIGIKLENHNISFLIRWRNFETHVLNTIFYSMSFNSLTWQTIGKEREIQ